MTESEEKIKRVLDIMKRSSDREIRGYSQELRRTFKRLNDERTERFNTLYEKNKRALKKEFEKGFECGRKER